MFLIIIPNEVAMMYLAFFSFVHTQKTNIYWLKVFEKKINIIIT